MSSSPKLSDKIKQAREMAKAIPSSSSSQILATLLIILHFAVFLSSFSGASAVIPKNNGTIQFIKTSCNSTTYPQLCCQSLSIYAAKIKADPKSLASVALNITLQTTRRTSALMKNLAKTAGGLRPRDLSVLSDCLEQLSDSMDELQQSIEEMNQNERSTDLGMKMSDIQTWVSAALTNEDTCMDGFDDGDQVRGDWIKILIRKHIIKVSELTSNALALINQFAHRLTSN